MERRVIPWLQHTLSRSQISRALLQWQQRIPQPLRYLGLIELYLICWAALDEIALLFESAPEISVWYPPVALDFVLLLVFGLRFIPALILNTFVHEYIVTKHDLGLVTLLISNAVTTIGYGGACALLLLKIKINPRLRTLRDVLWFVIVAALVTPLIVGILQALNFAWRGVIPFSGWLVYALHYWAGSGTGVAMLTPLLLVLLRRLPWVWAYKEHEPPLIEPPIVGLAPKHRWELLIEVIALCLAIWAAYGAQRGEHLDYSYFVFLPLIWIVTRHGFERATATVLFINIGVALLIQAKIGGSNVFALQFGMMAISLTGLLLGGFATQRMQAEKDLHHAAKRLRLLHEMDRSILAARSLFDIAQVALQRILQLVPYYRASVVMFDITRQEAIILGILDRNVTQVESGGTFPITALGNIELLQRGEINEVQEILTLSLLPIAQTLLGRRARAYINIPLLVQDELIGTLNLSKETPGKFQSQSIEIAQEVANQIAIAIQHTQLFEQAKQQANKERSLNQISRVLNSSLNPEAILQQIVQLTGEFFEVDRVDIFVFVSGQIQVLNEWRANEQVVSMENFTAPIADWTDLADPNSDFMRHGVFHAPDYAKEPLTPTRLWQIEHAQTRSVLSAPIFVRDNLFGGLSLQTTTIYRTFTEEEITFLQKIADQAAIALYNAQSYEILEDLVRQRTQELEQEKIVSEAANRAKSEFLSTMSHELRTPLTGILGFSSVLLEQVFGSLNAKQQQYIELISRSGKHLLELINDLLDLTKIEAGKEELYLEEVTIREIADECVSMFEARSQALGLELIVQIDQNVKTCIADKRRLKQILVNLLSNAVKFTESGSVTLQIAQTSTEIKFSVIDTGIGISPADQAKLFQAFQQLDSGLDRKYQGTGLGLVLSRKLAQLHGGDITIQSEPQRGSCFTLYLPLRSLVESG